LITKPELCLLTYRYVPKSVQALLVKRRASSDTKTQTELNELLGQLTQFIQKRQREDGLSFVSRTRIQVAKYNGEMCIVFRVVLANPLTTKEILQNILAEQCQISQESENFLPQLIAMVIKPV